MSGADTRNNRAYARLVHGGNDFVGLIAFALFKKKEVEWERAYMAAKGGAHPDDDARDNFERSLLLDSSVEELRQIANGALVQYNVQFLESQRPRIREEALTAEIIVARDRIAEARAHIERSQQLMPQLWNGFIVSILTTLALVLLVVALALFGVDVLDGLGALRPTSPARPPSP